MSFKRIFINPGHCPGIDSGAVGAYSTEADLVAQYGEVVANALRDAGYEVMVVQDDSLEYICEESNNFESDLFISIHCNSFHSPYAVGTEVFHLGYNSVGYDLANSIQSQLLETLGTVDRGVKTAGFYVLRYTNCPAVLVEVGFISNPEEENMLNNRVEDIGNAIARGISDMNVQ